MAMLCIKSEKKGFLKSLFFYFLKKLDFTSDLEKPCSHRGTNQSSFQSFRRNLFLFLIVAFVSMEKELVTIVFIVFGAAG